MSVREEAEKTFPPHADCKGVHQLAFRHVGRRFQAKLVPDLKEADIQSFLKTALGKKVQKNGFRSVFEGNGCGVYSSFKTSKNPMYRAS